MVLRGWAVFDKRGIPLQVSLHAVNTPDVSLPVYAALESKESPSRCASVSADTTMVATGPAHTLALTHTLSHTHILSLTIYLTHTLSLSHTQTFSHSLSHTFSHTLSHTIPLSSRCATRVERVALALRICLCGHHHGRHRSALCRTRIQSRRVFVIRIRFVHLFDQFVQDAILR